MYSIIQAYYQLKPGVREAVAIFFWATVLSVILAVAASQGGAL